MSTTETDHNRATSGGRITIHKIPTLIIMILRSSMTGDVPTIKFKRNIKKKKNERSKKLQNPVGMWIPELRSVPLTVIATLCQHMEAKDRREFHQYLGKIISK